MSLCEKIVNREETISLIGLGYVGIPIAVAFARKANVIGFDLDASKIELYKKGIDPTGEAFPSSATDMESYPMPASVLGMMVFV